MDIEINKERIDNTDWHAIGVDQALEKLNATSQGLTEQSVRQRLQQFGPNELPEIKRNGPLIRLLLQFHNVLIYILIVAGIVKAALGSWVDAGVIFAVVIVNGIIGFVQEGRAEKALDAIRQMLSLKATLRRDGQRVSVPTSEIVPGDVVLLASGDKVPADLRLIESRELRIDEAMLTGESVPAEKNIDALASETALGDRYSLAFSGTLVTSGRGVGVVVKTGEATELGKISNLVSATTAITTPLIAKVNRFAHFLAILIVVVAGLTIVIGYSMGRMSLIDLFFAAIALAVAAIPEGLPAIMTIVLAIGVRRMANRNAIIRRLAAVDTLGALTVICSDKTGTLTRNEMTVTSVAIADGIVDVSGTGYQPEGELSLNDQSLNLDDFSHLRMLLQAGILCSEADLTEENGVWRTSGDPMEGALLTLAAKAGLPFQQQRQTWETLDVIPFESENRFMATLHPVPKGEAAATKLGQRLAFIKGAPERILDCCHQVLTADGAREIDVNEWHQLEQQMANNGQRVLALACKSLKADAQQLDFESVQQDLMLLGLTGIIDPPRDEAIAAVQQCQGAGIRVVMITGDHALTARAIGQKLNIGDGQTATTGAEIDALDEPQLIETARRCSVFARVSPEHKLRLVEAIQANRQVVAMTGDGVNDAPALKRADVGIAMGLKGTEVTKEAAEMVLADDNFASIAKAVEEGRTVFDNLRKALLFILPTNGGEALTILAAILLGFVLPMTPVQVLWVNMITAVTLGLALAFEPPERDVMKRKPRDPSAHLLSRYFIWRILFVSVIMCVGTFGIFSWARLEGFAEDYARTLAVNTIVMFEAFYLFNTRFLTAPILNRQGLLGSRPVLISVALVIIFQILFTYFGPLQSIMGSTAITAKDWLKIVLIASSVLWIVEIEKWVMSRLERTGAEA